MIIKRWDGTAFVEEYPKTKAQLIYNDANNATIFDGNDKIKPAFLPDSVFDSLYFYSSISSNTALNTLTPLAIANAETLKRSAKGYYWIVNGTYTLTASATNAATLINGKYYRSFWYPAEGPLSPLSPNNDSVLEAGDWFILERVIGGDGLTEATAIVAYYASINNTYELATTSVDGIVRLSSRATYAALSGNNVVTEGVLKTVVDNASFAASGHVHGNITNAGAIGTTATLPIITTTGGVLTTGSFGTTAGTFAQGNDARLSDARTPLAHTHGNITNGGLIGTTANLPIITGTGGILQAGSFGTTANTFTQGNDARLSDARTPLSHTHGDISNGGAITSTFIAPASGDAIILSDASASDVLKRGISIGTGVTTYLRNDGSWETPTGTYAHPTYTAINANAADNGVAVIDLVTVDTTGHVTAVGTRNLSNATTSAAGVMSAADKTKLDGIAARALGGLSVTSNEFQMVHPFFVQTATPATPLTGTVWYDIN
jgi:hypothetical protein